MCYNKIIAASWFPDLPKGHWMGSGHGSGCLLSTVFSLVDILSGKIIATNPWGTFSVLFLFSDDRTSKKSTSEIHKIF